MSTRFRGLSTLLCVALGLTCVQAYAADNVDTLARDVDRLISLRQVKDVQRSYAHFALAGSWDEMAALFSADAKLIRDTETISGRKAIAEWSKHDHHSV